MAKKLYIIDDELSNLLGITILNEMKSEMTKVFTFLSGYTTGIVVERNLPKFLDFTDAVVKIVSANAEVGDAMASMKNSQRSAWAKYFTREHVRTSMDALVKGDLDPERGGVGWARKEVVTVGGTKYAVVLCGGVASLEAVADEVLTWFSPNHDTLEDARNRLRGRLSKASLNASNKDDLKKREDYANAEFKKAADIWALKDKKAKDWPNDLQVAVGVTLAREVCHEARHQYIPGGEHSQKGLGGEAVPLYGEPAFERFSEDDQKAIIATVKKLEQMQRGASKNVETFAN